MKTQKALQALIAYSSFLWRKYLMLEGNVGVFTNSAVARRKLLNEYLL
jgi:hypothetical protein